VDIKYKHRIVYLFYIKMGTMFDLQYKMGIYSTFCQPIGIGFDL
jgi:hypothetical protein